MCGVGCVGVGPGAGVVHADIKQQPKLSASNTIAFEKVDRIQGEEVKAQMATVVANVHRLSMCGVAWCVRVCVRVCVCVSVCVVGVCVSACVCGVFFGGIFSTHQASGSIDRIRGASADSRSLVLVGAALQAGLSPQQLHISLRTYRRYHTGFHVLHTQQPSSQGAQSPTQEAHTRLGGSVCHKCMVCFHPS